MAVPSASCPPAVPSRKNMAQLLKGMGMESPGGAGLC